MPFLHGLSPFPIVALNSIVLAMVAPFVLIAEIPKQYRFVTGNLIAALIILYGSLAWQWSAIDIQQDRWQAALQWTFSVMALWILVRRWIIVSQISFELISKIAFSTVIFLSISSMIEFILVNTTGLFFSDFIPFSVDQFPTANIFGADFIRPRVFSAEAGFTSMVFDLIIPLSYVHFIKSKLVGKLGFIVASLLGILSLFSVATLLSMIMSLAIYGIFKKNVTIITMIIVSAVIIIIAISLSGLDVSSLPIYKIVDFFDQANYYQSEGTRQETTAAGIAIITQHPFGMGWGTILQESKIPGSEIDRMIFGSGLISLWLELAVATGFVISLMSLCYITKILFTLLRLKKPHSDSCFIALFSLTFHHFAVFELWFPMLWFALALSQVVIKQQSTDVYASLLDCPPRRRR
jgi:hypothetical protein